MLQQRVIVSHSHIDNEFCHALVTALRQAGADVWSDEEDLVYGQLTATIERELQSRTTFVLVLSPAALRSTWVYLEYQAFLSRWRDDPENLTLLPVTASPMDGNDIWLFLRDFKRIEGPDKQPYPVMEAIRRTLQALGLDSPAPTRSDLDPSSGLRFGMGSGLTVTYSDGSTETFDEVPLGSGAEGDIYRSRDGLHIVKLYHLDAYRDASRVRRIETLINPMCKLF